MDNKKKTILLTVQWMDGVTSRKIHSCYVDLEDYRMALEKHEAAVQL